MFGLTQQMHYLPRLILIAVSAALFISPYVTGSNVRAPPALDFAIESSSVSAKTATPALNTADASIATDAAGFTYISFATNFVPSDFTFGGVAFFTTASPAFCYAVLRPSGSVYVFTQSKALVTYPATPTAGYITAVAVDAHGTSALNPNASVFIISTLDTTHAASTLSIPLQSGTDPLSAATMDLSGNANTRSFMTAFDSALNPKWALSALGSVGITTFLTVSVDSSRNRVWVAGNTNGDSLQLAVQTNATRQLLYLTDCLSVTKSNTVWEPFVLMIDTSGDISSIRTLCIQTATLRTPSCPAGNRGILTNRIGIDSAGQVYVASFFNRLDVSWSGGVSANSAQYHANAGNMNGIIAVRSVDSSGGNLTAKWSWVAGSTDVCCGGCGVGDTSDVIVSPSGDIYLLLATIGASVVNATTFQIDTNMCGSAPAPDGNFFQTPSGLMGSLLLRLPNTPNSNSAPAGPTWVTQMCDDANSGTMSGLAANTDGTQLYMVARAEEEWNTIGHLNSSGTYQQFTACAGPLPASVTSPPFGALACVQKIDAHSGDVLWSYGFTTNWADFIRGQPRAIAKSANGQLVMIGSNQAEGTGSTLYGPRFDLTHAPFGAWAGTPNSFNITIPYAKLLSEGLFVIGMDDACADGCPNGGTCTANGPLGSMTCTCATGYSGAQCQTNINECASAPCQNGGTCTDLINGFTCVCVAGFSGVLCQTNINECSSTPCQSGGTCTDITNGYTCACVSGFSGLRCQTDINECASTPCVNGGTCVDHIGSFSCTCVPGYSGSQCQTDINECASNPCQDGGSCTDGINSYTCL